MNLFREINARGTTVLVATHDRELIRRVGRRVDHARPRPHRRGSLMRDASSATRSRKRWRACWRGRQVGAAVDRRPSRWRCSSSAAFLLVSVNVQGVLGSSGAGRRVVGLSARRRDQRDGARRARGVPRVAAGGRGGRVRVEERRARALPADFPELARRDDRRSTTIRFRPRSKCGCGPRRRRRGGRRRWSRDAARDAGRRRRALRPPMAGAAGRHRDHRRGDRGAGRRRS